MLNVPPYTRCILLLAVSLTSFPALNRLAALSATTSSSCIMENLKPVRWWQTGRILHWLASGVWRGCELAVAVCRHPSRTRRDESNQLSATHHFTATRTASRPKPHPQTFTIFLFDTPLLYHNQCHDNNRISCGVVIIIVEIVKLLLLVCTSQFSSAVVLVLADAHHQHDLNLVIGDHQVTQYWWHDDSNSPISVHVIASSSPALITTSPCV